MQHFSKYRMITVSIILMFIFVIAAIYTNTKDVAAKKMQERNGIATPNLINTDKETDIAPAIGNSEGNNQETNNDNGNSNEIIKLTERITQLEQKVYTNNDEEQSVKCSVKGIIDDGHMVPLSPEDAVNESRTNNKEVIITCIFK